MHYLNYLILDFKIPQYAYFTDKETKVLSKIRDSKCEDKNPYLKRVSGSNNPVHYIPL